MRDFIVLAGVRTLLLAESIKKVFRAFENKGRQSSFTAGCKLIGVSGLSVSEWIYQQKCIRLSQLDLFCSAEYFTKKVSGFEWEKPLPDTKVYLAAHMGCHHDLVAAIIHKHTEPMQFFVPILPTDVHGKRARNMERLSVFGHAIEIGSSNDPKFILRMIKTCKRNSNAKVIIFIDLPRITSGQSINKECNLFGRKGTIISGHIDIISALKADSCLLSSNFCQGKPNKIRCSEVFYFDEPNLFESIKSEMEEQILSSPINWKYLDKVEFYYHNYTRST
ncbi:TPA: hypothetical protein RQK90_004722 [Vibrio vulnificus]|nr:hypothetical protein [Vibrio vulnificus]